MSLIEQRVETWQRANQQYLSEALAEVKVALEALVRGKSLGKNGASSHGSTAWNMDPPPALDTLCEAFGLSSFERNILLLCAGVELDSSIATLCATAQGIDERRGYPTFSLALAALSGAHWSALTPAAPLRYWRMVELSGDQSLTMDQLCIDERILHFLTGVQYIDDRLTGLVDPAPAPINPLTPSQAVMVDRVVTTWDPHNVAKRPPVVHLSGADFETRRDVAALACLKLGITLHTISAAVLPVDIQQLELFARLWERETVLSDCALLLDCDSIDGADVGRRAAIGQFIERSRSVLLVSSTEPDTIQSQSDVSITIEPPTAGEQIAIWQQSIDGRAVDQQSINALVSQFTLSPKSIRDACVEASNETSQAVDYRQLVWNACRRQSRPRLERLAQRLQPKATWSDLVLPEPQLQLLREVAIHVRERSTVYHDWGFARRYSRGLGIGLLCAGPTGTGKTMAAEVLANELNLDLYRIDLSEVVSKYIGETEKNLSRLFAAAEGGGAILLFDEADALFGKRSEIKDSHDRYANIEISYLLQRMETFEGLTILTTNLKDALDTAFLRRLRFVVQFPFPDVSQRELIWRGVFPPDTPTTDLDMTRLSRLNLSGGLIRNVAMNAAFLAANDREPVSMKHLAMAARSEHTKMEKPLNESEIGSWT